MNADTIRMRSGVRDGVVLAQQNAVSREGIVMTPKGEEGQSQGIKASSYHADVAAWSH